jgi:hypothetical protein
VLVAVAFGLSIVMSSLDAAHAYLEEQGQVIRTDTVSGLR